MPRFHGSLIIRQYGLITLQAAVTIVLLFFVWRQVNWTEFARLVAVIPVSFYLISFVAVLIMQLAYAIRWHLILRSLSVPVSLSVTVKQYLVGSFLNNFLPSTIGGDTAKVYYLGREAGYLRVTASVMVDRLVGLFLVMSLALALVGSVDGRVSAFAVARTGIVLIWAVAAAALLTVRFAPVHAWAGRIAASRPSLSRYAVGAGDLAGFAQTTLRRPYTLVGAALTVLAAFLLLGFVYQHFIGLVTGVRPPLMAVVSVVAIIATLSNIPMSVNGLGLREQLHMTLLGTFDVAPEAAAGISLLLFTHQLLLSLSGAWFWLRASPRRQSL